MPSTQAIRACEPENRELILKAIQSGESIDTAFRNAGLSGNFIYGEVKKLGKRGEEPFASFHLEIIKAKKNSPKPALLTTGVRPRKSKEELAILPVQNFEDGSAFIPRSVPRVMIPMLRMPGPGQHEVTPERQTVVVLCKVLGFPNKKIAEMLGTSVKNLEENYAEQISVGVEELKTVLTAKAIQVALGDDERGVAPDPIMLRSLLSSIAGLSEKTAATNVNVQTNVVVPMTREEALAELEAGGALALRLKTQRASLALAQGGKADEVIDAK